MRLASFLRTGTCAAIFALAAPACLMTTGRPEHTPSSQRAFWALGYPAMVTSTVSEFEERDAELAKLLAAEAGFVDKLKTKDAELLREVYGAADNDGRSAAYAERLQETRQIRSFLASHKEITGRVAIACQAAAKQKGTDLEPTGAVGYALREGVDHELTKHLRNAGDYRFIIERNRSALGPTDAKALEAQADDVAYASYVAYVGLSETRARLDGLVAEAPRVRAAGAEFIAEEMAVDGRSGRTDADKKASEERIAAMDRSLAAIDPALETARILSQNAENRLNVAREKRAASFRDLRARARSVSSR